MLKNYIFKNIHLKNTINNIQLTQKAYFTQTNENKFKSELDKVNLSGKLKIYEIRNYKDEHKSILRMSLLMGFISGSVIVFTSVPWFLKFINLIVFVPCVLIQVDHLLGSVVIIKTIHLLPNNQIEITDANGKIEIVDISNIKNAKDDERFPQRNNFNYVLFDIFTNAKTNRVYHLSKDSVVLNKDLIDNILEGKKLI
jgi:hypothetical protein